MTPPKKRKKSLLERKRKAGSEDFAKRKAKVGRKVARHANETSASFATRRVSVSEQSILKGREGVVVSVRGLSFEEHAAQLGHHNERSRSAACACIREMLARSPELLAAKGDECLEASAGLVNDESRRVRAEALALFRGLVSRRSTAAPVVVARLGAALASLDPARRFDAAKALSAALVDGASRENFMAPSLWPPVAAALRVAVLRRGETYRAQLLRIACVLVTGDRRDRVGFGPDDDDDEEDFLPVEADGCGWPGAALVFRRRHLDDDQPAAEPVDAALEIARRAGAIATEAVAEDRVDEAEAATALVRRVCLWRRNDPAVVRECERIRHRLAEAAPEAARPRVVAALAAAAIDEGSRVAVDILLSSSPRGLVGRFLRSPAYAEADRRRVLEASGMLSTARSDAADARVVANLCDRDLRAARPEWLAAVCASPARDAATKLAFRVARRGLGLEEPARKAVADGLAALAREPGIAPAFAHLHHRIPREALEAVLAPPHDAAWARHAAAVATALSRRDDDDVEDLEFFFASLLESCARARFRSAFFAACAAARRCGASPDIAPLVADGEEFALYAGLLRDDPPPSLAPIVLRFLARDERRHLETSDFPEHHPAVAALHILARSAGVRSAFCALVEPPSLDHLLALARLGRDPRRAMPPDLRAAAARAAAAATDDPYLRDNALRLDALLRRTPLPDRATYS